MRLLTRVLPLLFAFSLFAQEPRYRLERILVEGPAEAEDIVRAEARLDEEKTYVAEDFRQALYRVRRLPFVADATWRIEPGITAGSTTLVIQIMTTRSIFYSVDAHSEQRAGDNELNADAFFGARKLLGDLGTIEGVVGQHHNDDGLTAALTYRAYDLLGRGAFAALSVGYRYSAETLRYDPDLDLLLGWPLSQKQSLIGEITRRKSRLLRDFDINTSDTVTLIDRDANERAALRWSYQSIDDPLFTRRGTSFIAGPIWSRDKRIRQVYDVPSKKVVGTETWTERYGVDIDLASYRPLGDRNAGFLRLRGDATTSETDRRIFGARALAGIAHDFHAPSDDRLHPVRARFELSAGYGRSAIQEDGIDLYRNDGPIAEGAFILRHSWGTVRFTATYASD